MLADFYTPVHLTHVAAVAASGALFAIRGLAALLGAAWTMARGLRLLSYAIDSVLLAGGIALTLIIHQFPFAAPWLTVKLALLAIYIVLGSFALKRARTRRQRLASYVAALATFGTIVAVAMTRNPLGILSFITGT